MPDSFSSNSFVGDGFLVPEFKGGSEASEDDQADNVSNEAVCVIGLHGSGDEISGYLQEWEVAKVALSCHIALGFGFWARLVLQKGKEVYDMSF